MKTLIKNGMILTTENEFKSDILIVEDVYKRQKLSSRYPAMGRNRMVATDMAVNTIPMPEPVMPIS